MTTRKHLTIAGFILAMVAVSMAPAVGSKLENSSTVANKVPQAAHSVQLPIQNRPLLVAQIQETCFSKGEKTDGMNKTCFYSCPSGEAAITISAASLCPLSIKR
jgi:hypothetical protein